MGEGIIEIAKESYVVAYVTAACATIVLYDYLLTFGIEVQRIWPMRFAGPKFLFLANRYIVLPMLVFNGIVSTRSNLSASFCIFYLRWLDIVITVSTAIIDAILLTRVLVLYQRSLGIRIFSIMTYTGGTLTSLAITLNDYIGQSVHIAEGLSTLPGCYAASVPGTIVGYWISSTIVESVLFALVMWRVVTWSFDNYGIPPTMVLIARDSSVYFASIFSLLFVNLFVFEYAPPNLSSLFVTPASAVGCIAGSHMLMNLRGSDESNRLHFVNSDFELSRIGGVTESWDRNSSGASSPVQFGSSAHRTTSRASCTSTAISRSETRPDAS